MNKRSHELRATRPKPVEAFIHKLVFFFMLNQQKRCCVAARELTHFENWIEPIIYACTADRICVRPQNIYTIDADTAPTTCDEALYLQQKVS